MFSASILCPPSTTFQSHPAVSMSKSPARHVKVFDVRPLAFRTRTDAAENVKQQSHEN